ncbi:Na-translocating system protein MpsC family protein [Bacillus pinisoli]|uniref:Na-translocating system protein MpsC family protein n=1 Tax=Bacillus pinisoli TaxID=2901866 RepID=UPI001FF6C4EB|nr:Na-translocating system protein MpsC family protein [Bacillus pinisoli]
MNKVYSKNQEDLLQLGSSLSRMLKQRFGKGPETCFVTLHSERLTIFVRNFITPAEEVLIERNQINLAYKFRNTVMEKVYQQFIEVAEKKLSLTFDVCISDWDYELNTGMILVERKSQPSDWSDAKPLVGRLLNLIQDISTENHKVPKSTRVMKINQNIVGIQFEGIMLQTEKVLFHKGYHDLLLEHSLQIKNSYKENKNYFEPVFGRNVEGIYMTWNYHSDQCYIFFYLQ